MRRFKAYGSREPSMTIQHSHTTVAANVFILGADNPNPAYMVCFGRLSGESPETTEARWDRLAQQMFNMGLEPPEDEPFYTVVEDGVVWDHYSLVAISDDRVADERSLHV